MSHKYTTCDACGDKPQPDRHALHVPAEGAWLVVDGKVYRVHPDGAWVEIKASWRIRWSVTTDAEPLP